MATEWRSFPRDTLYLIDLIIRDPHHKPKRVYYLSLLYSLINKGKNKKKFRADGGKVIGLVKGRGKGGYYGCENCFEKMGGIRRKLR